MKQIHWYILLGTGLILTSVLSYLLQISLFHKPDDTLFYMLQDISFVPIQVLLVTFLIDRLLRRKEKEALMKKLNMLIGVFINEMGTKLIQHFSVFTDNFAEIGPELRITGGWSEKIFIEKKRNVRNFRYALTLREDDFLKMRVFLLEKREMMLQLLENPNLLEHDTFTELLLAVFHLTDELQYRGSFENLPKPDYEHLKGDINRAYALIITEWLAYMNYLRKDYPYLYSLAVRTNPFNPEARITVS